jgi:hypothetical protein
MGAIDVGIVGGVTEEANSGVNRTWILKDNPANDSGKLTRVQGKTNTAVTNLIVATFYNTGGSNFSTRDYQDLGAVNGVFDLVADIDVVAGDYLGFGNANGTLWVHLTGHSGTWRDITGVQIPCTNFTFTDNSAVYGLYFKAADSKWWKADASAEATTRGRLLLCPVAISADAIGIGIKSGYVYNTGWNWSLSADIFLSITAGALSQTAPTVAGEQVRIVATPESADSLIWVGGTDLAYGEI